MRVPLQHWFKTLSRRWASFLEQSIPLREMRDERIASALPSFSFFALLLSATVIATLGLISNSSAVVIGAMIVAPLMNPILSAAFAMTAGDRHLMRRSLTTLLLGVGLTIGAAFVMTLLLPVTIVGSEVMARTSPNLIDLMIAVAAGFAGAFSITRYRIGSSIAGVAIAVALVPPLCVTGIGLGLGQEIGVTIGVTAVKELGSRVAGGSFLLFLANLVGITVAACVVFLAQGYGSLRRAWGYVVAWLLLAALLLGPLSYALNEFLLTKKVDGMLDRLAATEPQRWERIRVRDLDVQIDGSKAVVDVILEAPQGLVDTTVMEATRQKMLASLRPHGIRELEARIRVVPIQVFVLGGGKP